ncbi:copper homeostasis membrane protein CopD [Phyllobacterium myrsinacearum]|uniref:Putative copper resistance protein D n=1 Tax=Phyllobacterium myrsinacearum TaxID=28101 RepID=A0A839ENK8_9HYPH|nr:copper homeostasis membrane protein CopD [Phyllobacterium myrsinacearum]MBA8880432.1 putative copper resistance protein D [Phyllobacterium myrsinacearum]
MEPATALIFCRLVHYASTMFLWGAFAYLTLLVPKTLALDTGRRLHAARVAAILLALTSTFLALPLQAGAIGQGWSDAANLTTIRDVLFETSVGHSWLFQAATALLLIPALFLPVHKAHAVAAAASGLLLMSLALTGHAAMQEGWAGVAHQINDMAHVLAGGAWIGALVPVMLVLGKLYQPTLHASAQLALMRFSTAGHIAVALVIASGIVNTLLILGHIPADLSSPYQFLLLTKIVLVILLTALAIINRYVFVPRMRFDEASAVQAIWYGTLVEIVLGIAVLGLVAWFGMLEPA